MREKRLFGHNKVLRLADGSCWSIVSADERLSLIRQRFEEIMGMDEACPIPPSTPELSRRLILEYEEDLDGLFPMQLPAQGNVDIRLRCPPGSIGEDPLPLLVFTAIAIAREIQARGGALLHGALVEYRGQGIILAGPGGIGKSTASGRLPGPWKALSDDTCLVARSCEGRYWAHPWPTWSRFMPDGPGGNWSVGVAVPLAGIFFLVRASNDRVRGIGTGQLTSLLIESAKQVSWPMTKGMSTTGAKNHHLERFQSLCGLAKSVTGGLLHISLDGSFWEHLERVLAG